MPSCCLDLRNIAASLKHLRIGWFGVRRELILPKHSSSTPQQIEIGHGASFDLPDAAYRAKQLPCCTQRWASHLIRFARSSRIPFKDNHTTMSKHSQVIWSKKQQQRNVLAVTTKTIGSQQCMTSILPRLGWLGYSNWTTLRWHVQ
jgi:hypothetical protein